MTRNLFTAFALVISLMVGGFAMAEETVPGVNINTASAQVLAQSLQNIGEAKAQSIVAYREENGPFESVEDLRKVKGIGAATIATNRDNIIVE